MKKNRLQREMINPVFYSGVDNSGGEVDFDRIVFSDTREISVGIGKIPAAAAICELPELPDLQLCYEIDHLTEGEPSGGISEGRDRLLGRRVTIKSLAPAEAADPVKRAHFLQEARLTAELDHPAVNPVYQVCGDREGGLHLVFKKLSGKTLRNYLLKLCSIYSMIPDHAVRRSETAAIRQRLGYFLTMCNAMSFAHNRGVLHRNLKPENIFLTGFNTVYIQDWSSAEMETDGCDPGQTNYIAPEVLEKESFNIRSEIYALGLILFDMVFLKPPFPGNSEDILRRVKSHSIQTFRHRFGCQVDDDLRMIVEKSTDPTPENRYAEVSELSHDIQRYLVYEPVAANPGGCVRRWLKRVVRRG